MQLILTQPNTKVQFVSPKDFAVFSDEFSDTESDATVDNEMTRVTILKRQVRIITHLTQANNRTKV